MSFLWSLLIVLVAIWIFVMAVIVIYHLLTRQYVDRYTLTLYFGRKGCGKSSTMQKLIRQHLRRGWHVYADTGSTRIEGVTQINGKYFYKNDYPPDSVIFLDESVIKFNNRDWKNFETAAQEWFVQQRHHRCKVIMFANTFGVDSKIRDLNDELVLCRKYLRIFMVGRRYYKIPIIITAEESNREAVECDDYRKIPIIFGGLRFTFLPKYVKYFNTHEIFSEIDQKDSKKNKEKAVPAATAPGAPDSSAS